MIRTASGQSRASVRYAVVGLGHISQTAVLPAFANAENSELVALVSSDPGKLAMLAARHGARRAVSYDEYDRLLTSGDVDAVYLAVPNHLHCEFAVRAARAGVHVLCEKPMAVTESECERMIAAAAEADVRLMVAYRLHFEAANLEAVEIARRGEIGELRFFESTFSQTVSRGDIRLAPTALGGGTVYDMGVYCINAARYLFRDEPIEVAAFSASARGDGRFADCDEMTTAILRFPGDRLAAFTTSFGAADISAYHLVGSSGELTMDPAYEYATQLGYEVIVGGRRTRQRRFPKRDQFGPELIYFSHCILHDEEPEPDGAEGLADVRVIRAIYESATRGHSLELARVEQSKRPGLGQLITRPGIQRPQEFHASWPKPAPRQ